MARQIVGYDVRLLLLIAGASW